MKQIILNSICILTFSFSHAQVISITNDIINTVYVGIDNPLTIAVENHSNKSLVVTASRGGSLKKSGNKYIYYTNSPGSVTISIFKKNGKNELIPIGKRYFHAKLIPTEKFVMAVGPCRGGNIQFAVFKAQNQLRYEIRGLDFEANFPIDSFSVTIFRRDSIICNKIKNKGNTFNKELREAFDTKLKSGDKVVFNNIFVSKPYIRKHEDVIFNCIH